MPQVPGPENVGHGGRPHRHPRMAAVGLLDGIDGQEADCVDAEIIKRGGRGRG